MKSKRKYLIAFFTILLFSLTTCYFAYERENPFDPKSDKYREFHGIKIIDSEGNFGFRSTVVASGDNIFVGYQEGNGKFRIAVSNDTGYNFTATYIDQVTVDYLGIYNSIDISGNTVYASYCYFNVIPGDSDIQFAKSIDGGKTWPASSLKEIVDSGNGTAGENSIRVDGEKIYIAYYDSSSSGILKLAKSANGGTDWTITDIDNDAVNNVGKHNAIAVDDAYIYVCYHDQTNVELVFNRSSDYGVSWDSPWYDIDSSGNSHGYYTSIAADGTNVYISYYDMTVHDLKFIRSINRGSVWSAVQIIDGNSTDNGKTNGDVGLYTSIAAYNGCVYISYRDNENQSLKLARSTDNGDTWTIMTVDTGDVGNFGTSITVAGNKVYISYYDTTNGVLKLAKSIDGGATW